VMSGLSHLPPSQGIAAMNSINVSAVTPMFMSLLFGTAAICALLTVHGIFHWGEPGVRFAFIGSVVFLVGAIAGTMLGNVPRNNALARLDPGGLNSAQLWAEFLSSWTALNHLRTLSSVASATLLALSLREL
jgi:uncharacterized membrane protein